MSGFRGLLWILNPIIQPEIKICRLIKKIMNGKYILI